jgi:hypothetical protein
MRYDSRLGYNAPIKMDRVNRVYYYEDENYSIDNIPLSEDELESIETLFKTHADVGTVNNGTQLVGACAVANSNGVMVGLNTTGPELARIEEALGFLEGYL